MSVLRLILGDQLSESLASLEDIDPQKDVVMLCEVMEEATYVRHHKKKIAFLFAAMRHFAEDLRARGISIRYIALDDPDNSGSLDGELKRAIQALKPDRLILTEPGEYRVLQQMHTWRGSLGIPVEIRVDHRFLCSIESFNQWASGKKQMRMEFFYRDMRKKHTILMEADGKPTGLQWNYDKDNRKPPKTGMRSPQRIAHPKSPIVKSVLNLVKHRFSTHFGDLEPFHYAVTRREALMELDQFISDCLPYFGDYQDAMVSGEPYLYHSLISTYLNAGLLLPLEICQKAESAYRSGNAPLNAVEGFIRQVLGWREYIRGIYWHHMPSYAELNALNAKEPMPEFYWTGQTDMFCLKEAINHTKMHAYSHHIQRLMVTGNFALLAGLDVKAVQDWYLAVYSDAYEWVEMPNTLGMALFGDGGITASKPYAASGKYIQRMSNFCQQCRYDPNTLIGDKACPLNALYWTFFSRHESELRGNQRLPYVYTTWDKFSPEKKQAIQEMAMKHMERMREGTL